MIKKMARVINYKGNSMHPTLKMGDRLDVVPYQDRHIRVGDGARVGAQVRLALTTPGSAEERLVEGVVVRGSTAGLGGTTGAVAVPESASAVVAGAARANQLVVLVGG